MTPFRRLVLALASAVAFLGLLETGLRIAGFAYPPREDPIVLWNPARDRAMQEGRSTFAPDPRQLWAPRPGAGVPSGVGETINEAGCRGPLRAFEKPAGVLRIVTLGDSSTFGYGVPYADTYSAQLEALLRERGREAEVIDCGVVGHSVRQGIERWRALAGRFHADVVVEAYGAVNEHFGAQGPRDAEKIERPAGGGPGWLRQHLRSMHLVARIADGMRGPVQFESDVPSYESEAARAMGQTDWKGDRRVPLAEFEPAMGTLLDAIEQGSARPVMLSFPRPADVEARLPVLLEYTRVVESVAARRGIALVDGRRVFRDAAADDRLFVDHWHPTREGHALLARALADEILKAAPPK